MILELRNLTTDAENGEMLLFQINTPLFKNEGVLIASGNIDELMTAFDSLINEATFKGETATFRTFSAAEETTQEGWYFIDQTGFFENGFGIIKILKTQEGVTTHLPARNSATGSVYDLIDELRKKLKQLGF